MMRVVKLLVLLGVVLAIGMVVTRGIHARIQTASEVSEQTHNLATPSVTVIHPKPGSLSDQLTLPGGIQAFRDAPVYARANGYVKRWTADIGQHVKSGEVLAEIDAPEQDSQVTQAKSTLQQAQSALEQAIANRRQAQANENLARTTADRWAQLYAQGIAAKQDNDTYQSQLQAQIATGQASEQAIAVARNSVAAAQANVAVLEQNGSYRTVSAPFDGIVTARSTDVGRLIASGNSGVELFHIADMSKVRVFIGVPQADSRSALPGTPADVTLAEYPNRHFRGTVVRNSETIDPATRTLLTEIDLDNPTGELHPGAFAQVHLALRTAARALILPVNTFIFRSEGMRVAVVRDNKVQLMPVTMGKDFGNQIEVLSGISETDDIVVDPPDSLGSGMTVRVVKNPKTQ